MEDFPEPFRKYINDYPLHILEVNQLEHLEYFKTDLKLVFGFLQNRSSTRRMKEFIRENEAQLSAVDDEAYDMMVAMSHSEELEQMKNRFRKKGKVDMCKALKEWMEESKQEGQCEGEARFAALTEKLLKDDRAEELLKATSDKVYRDKLYKEYKL